MNDCCTNLNTSSHPQCPVGGNRCIKVSYKTVLQHVKTPWKENVKPQDYFFCDDPACEIVYFSSEGEKITKHQLRSRVGVKEMLDDSPLCYCFDISLRDYKDNPSLIDFVKEKTRQALCDCSARNPSGRCCLKDFPQVS